MSNLSWLWDMPWAYITFAGIVLLLNFLPRPNR
jgi:hypothetical protein